MDEFNEMFDEIVADVDIDPGITPESVFFDEVRSWISHSRENLEAVVDGVERAVDSGKPEMVLFVIAQYAAHLYGEVPGLAARIKRGGLADHETLENALGAAVAVVELRNRLQSGRPLDED